MNKNCRSCYFHDDRHFIIYFRLTLLCLNKSRLLNSTQKDVSTYCAGELRVENMRAVNMSSFEVTHYWSYTTKMTQGATAIDKTKHNQLVCSRNITAQGCRGTYVHPESPQLAVATVCIHKSIRILKNITMSNINAYRVNSNQTS